MTPGEFASAVELFERRTGFEFSEDYDQSREWSDAVADVMDSTNGGE